MYNFTFSSHEKVLIYTKYTTTKEKIWLEFDVLEAGLILPTGRFNSYFLYKRLKIKYI